MTARATWKGFLQISLVNIPIKVFPATESSGTISFNQLHGECQTRIQQKRWCPHCDREVPNSEIVKGYEFEKGRYVVLSEEDFDKVRPESTRVINLVQFADDSAIDPMYVDRAYYLAPDGTMAADAFAVMREGMKGKWGSVSSRSTVGSTWSPPQGHGIVMYTLHHAAEMVCRLRERTLIDDIIDVNCSRCGSPLHVPLDDLRDARMVECSACSPAGNAGERASVTEPSAKPSDRVEAKRANQR